MKYRNNVNKRRDRKSFSRNSNKTNKRNLIRPMRGGICL